MSRQAIPISELRPTRSHPRLVRHARYLPVVVFVALVVGLAWGLGHDPGIVPSTLVGRPVPQFDLPPVKGRALGLSSADLQGEASLVNVFASWCTACRDEHPIFMELRRNGTILIHGINYKDRPDDASQLLESLGDPYTRTGADLDGRVSIDWGVYGVPETFLVSPEGIVLYKHIGPVTEEDLRTRILPLVEGSRR